MGYPFKSWLIVIGLSFPVVVWLSLPWENAPEAQSFSAMVQEEGETQIFLYADQSNVLFKILNQPKHGSLTGDGAILVYRPEVNFFGQDSFTYVASKKQLEGGSATVTIEVSNLNDPPVALDQDVKTTQGQAKSIQLDATDIEGDRLVYKVLSKPLHGKLKGAPPFVTYQPDPDYQGEDQFSFAAVDPDSVSPPGVVRVAVGPPNQPPEVTSSGFIVIGNKKKVFRLHGLDPEGEPVRFYLVQGTESGTLVESGEQEWAYQPKKGFVGVDVAEFRAFDGFAYSGTKKVRFKVMDPQKGRLWSNHVQEVLGKGGLITGGSEYPDLVFGSQQYIPASVIKLATAAAALKLLGPKTKFSTLVYKDDSNNLIIKGLGDPGFRTQDWVKLASALKEKGVFGQPINNLCVDLSGYELRPEFEGRERGIEPFYAPIGPLVTNANLATLKVRSRKLYSYNPNTPITDAVRRRAKGLPNGLQQLNVAPNARAGAQYSLEVADHIFKKAGMKRQGKLRFHEKVPGDLLVLEYQSDKTVEYLVKRMLYRSSNYIANQLVMALALKQHGTPAKLSEGVEVIQRFLKTEVGIEKNEIFLTEGSGIDRDNKVSLPGMLKLMNYFGQYKDLLPGLKQNHHKEFRNLPKNRLVWLKTGTLEGVANVVGYIQLDSGGYKPFVIFAEGNRSVRGQMLALLLEAYSGS